jgi:arsenate reductase-like glutaredoxin family protein
LKHGQARHDLRHQELRHHEEGARLARPARRRLRVPRLQGGIERGRLETWSRDVGWETLLNRAGTTFRALPDKDKDGLTAKKAIALMMAQPAMIKRPVLDVGGTLLVGFKPEQYAKAFGT